MLQLQHSATDVIIYFQTDKPRLYLGNCSRKGRNMQNHINDILKCPLFNHIKREDLPIMLQCMGYNINQFSKDDFILMEQENINKIGIILKGHVNMIKEDIWGNRTTLVRMKPYEVFGETFSCSMDTVSTVSFTAATDCTVIFLPFNKVMYSCSMVCRYHHRMIENMVKLIAEKNKELMVKIEIISKKTLREKLLAYLSMQSQLYDTKYFEIPISRTELAEYICADRSAMTRELAKMREEGLIDYDKNIFRLQ